MAVGFNGRSSAEGVLVMEKSETIAKLGAAIVKVQAELPAIPKDRTNPITHSKYATLGAINKVLLPVTSKNEIAVTQYPVSGPAGQVGCGTLLIHSSGEFINYDPFFINSDRNKRMSAAQEGGSAITYAKRYQLCAIFGIVPDEDADGAMQQQQSNGNQYYPNGQGDPRQAQNQRYNGQQYQQGYNQQGYPQQNGQNQRGGGQGQQEFIPIETGQMAQLVNLFKAMAESSGSSIVPVQNGYLGKVKAQNVQSLSYGQARWLIEKATHDLEIQNNVPQGQQNSQVQQTQSGVSQ